MKKIMALAVLIIALGLLSAYVNAEELNNSVMLTTNDGTNEVLRTQEVNLVLKASGIQDLYTMQLELTYDPERLELLPENIQNMAWTGEQNGYSKVEVNAETGVVKLLYSKKGNTQGVSGDVNLLGLTFRTLRIGITNIQLSKALFVDSAEQNINIDVTSDYEVNVLPNPLNVELAGTKGESDWYISTVNIDINDIDAQTIEYILDDTSYIYEEPITLDSGIHQLAITTNDGYGFIKQQSIELKIDTISPEISASPESMEWQNQTIAVTPLYMDEGSSELKETWYSWSNDETLVNEWITYVEGALEQPTEGVWYLHTKALDNAGRETIKTFGPYKADYTVPEISIDVENREWENTDISVNPVFTDMGGSEIKDINYQWSLEQNIPEIWNTYTSGELTQTEDGSWYIHLKVEDNAGNSVTAMYGPYQVDKTSPEAKASPESVAWTNVDITVMPEYIDLGGSQISSMQYLWSKSQDIPSEMSEYLGGDLTQAEQGVWYLHMQASDFAGNSAAYCYGPYQIDLTYPTISVDIESREWESADIIVIPAIDDEGGSDIQEMNYAWSQTTEIPTNWNTYNVGAITQTQDGIWYLSIKAKDNAGNETIQQYGSYKVDKTSPSINITNVSEGVDYTESVVPVIEINDEESGVEEQSITLDGQAYVIGTPITQQGTHNLSVRVVDNAGNEAIQSVSFMIYANTELSVTVPSCEYSDHTRITAQLVSRNKGVADASVSFIVNGEDMGYVQTNEQGIATLDYHTTLTQGNYTVTVSYVQDNDRYLREAYADTTLEVLNEKATISYTGDYIVQYPNQITLSAQILQENDESMGDYTLANILFEVYKVNADGTAALIENRTVNVDASGIASMVSTYEVGVYSITATIVDNGIYESSSDTAIAPVYDPNGGFATGGGWINVTNPDEGNLGKANFGFNAKYKDSAANGNLEFQYKDGDINMKSISIDWLTISSTSAQFQGTATIKGWEGVYTFRVSCTDNKDEKKSDKFTIKIWAGTDTDADPIYKANNQDIGGGNILVKTK